MLTSRQLGLLKEKGICPVCRNKTTISGVASIITYEVGIRCNTCNHLVLPFSMNPFQYPCCPDHFQIIDNT